MFTNGIKNKSVILMTAAKMSGKLIIHKFETGLNFKSLQISIEEDNESSETKFSEWLDGRSFQKKKENEKLPRLVVKIVTGNEISNFNLDSCAKLINNLEHEPYQDPANINEKVNEKYNAEVQNTNVTHGNDGLRQLHTYYHNDKEQSYNEQFVKSNNEIMTSRPSYNNSNNTPNEACPLEYSLEKVKENNARIMENIHMLNLTLNYTKKKETFDTVCPKSIQSFPCETCGKCFVYETGLKRHYTIRHSILETQPRWQVVWTCVECFQVWPQYDLALKHSSQCCRSDNTDCVREIKTSLVLQCEFCEKVFTSIPRLVRHAKMHTTNNNYECNACNITFKSYKVAEEHWLLCPWLKTCYTFSLPKLLLCNACDRKFRNYEQLYNHRYKIGHFMAKLANNPSGIYLYQCELCGKCCSSTSLLQAHKRQCHPFHGTTAYNMVNNYNEFDGNYSTSINNQHDDCINQQN